MIRTKILHSLYFKVYTHYSVLFKKHIFNTLLKIRLLNIILKGKININTLIKYLFAENNPFFIFFLNNLKSCLVGILDLILIFKLHSTLFQKNWTVNLFFIDSRPFFLGFCTLFQTKNYSNTAAGVGTEVFVLRCTRVRETTSDLRSFENDRKCLMAERTLRSSEFIILLVIVSVANLRARVCA